MVDHGHRHASCDTSPVSGGVDCGRRRRNVYDKKPRRYAKENRTAHLTACSDKSVAYVTNNKRLYSTFCKILLKLTTDRHEASRHIFATSELLVLKHKQYVHCTYAKNSLSALHKGCSSNCPQGRWDGNGFLSGGCMHNNIKLVLRDEDIQVNIIRSFVDHVDYVLK